MTGPASCLRCDWEGDTEATSCPDCGAVLYRFAAPPPSARTTVSPDRSAPVDDEDQREARYLPGDRALAPSRSRRVSRPFTGFVVFALLVTAGLWWFLRAHEVPTSDPAAGPPTGRIVYVTGSPGGQQLWGIDLQTGASTQGPVVTDEIVHLVSAADSLPGWVGLTTRRADGSFVASVLRSQTADASPEPVLTGSLVAWGPNGASVVSAGLGSVANGCYATLKFFRDSSIQLGEFERAYRRVQFCGEIPSIGQDAALTYFTWVRARGAGIFYIGNGSPHRVLSGYELLSISATADMIVTPAGGAAAAALFYRNAGAADPYTVEGKPLVIDRVLAWTANADAALVTGRVGTRDGLYLLDTTPGGDRVPAYVGPAAPGTSAAPADDGSLFISNGGRIQIWRNGDLASFDVPDGVPPPDGPIAWLPV